MSRQAPLAQQRWAQVAANPFISISRRHGVRCLLRDTLSNKVFVKAMAKVVGSSAIVAASKKFLAEIGGRRKHSDREGTYSGRDVQ